MNADQLLSECCRMIDTEYRAYLATSSVNMEDFHMLKIHKATDTIATIFTREMAAVIQTDIIRAVR